jgi:hypothetical protein
MPAPPSHWSSCALPHEAPNAAPSRFEPAKKVPADVACRACEEDGGHVFECNARWFEYQDNRPRGEIDVHHETEFPARLKGVQKETVSLTILLYS